MTKGLFRPKPHWLTSRSERGQVAVAKHSESAKDLRAQIARLELKIERYRLKRPATVPLEWACCIRCLAFRSVHFQSVSCDRFLIDIHSRFGQIFWHLQVQSEEPRPLSAGAAVSQVPSAKDSRPSEAKRPSGDDADPQSLVVEALPAPSAPKPKPKVAPGPRISTGRSDIQDDIAKLLEMNKADKKRRGRATERGYIYRKK